MTPSLEQHLRSRLAIPRFFQAYVPLTLSRWLIKKGMARVKLGEEITREVIDAGGVPCEWLIPAGAPEGKVLLYLHGGGFVYPAAPPHLELLAFLSKEMGVRVLLVDYRLAPDHPFPAPLDDCVGAYLWLLEQGVSPEHIVLAGDSAGGHLTVTTLMKLRDEGHPLPAAAACLSPVGDLTGKPNLMADKDPLLHPKAGRFFRASFIGQNDAEHPLISPVLGDWKGLPPLLIHAGEDELLRDDALAMEALAKAAGVEVQCEIYPRMWHVWQLYLELPQAKESLSKIAAFLRSHLPG